MAWSTRQSVNGRKTNEQGSVQAFTTTARRPGRPQIRTVVKPRPSPAVSSLGDPSPRRAGRLCIGLCPDQKWTNLPRHSVRVSRFVLKHPILDLTVVAFVVVCAPTLSKRWLDQII